MSNRFKILIYTDSRGEHVPKGSNHVIYSKRIANDKRFDVTLCLCKMKWTTTLDFLEYMYENNIEPYEYDLIILHTGIVEHSPRHKSTALNSFYDNKEYGKFNYQDFDNNSKIINSKKDIFDKIFGEENMIEYLNTSFDYTYENEHTINMYSIEMAEKYLLPKLKKIPNLIWISSNKIVPGWNGNYFRKRPENIGIVEKYSELFAKELPWVLDLNNWSFEEIKQYTCDNMHLTKAGSNYIYKKLMENIELKYKHRDTIVIMGNGPSLKKVNIDHLRYFDCFGLNAAHRIYDEISFYPKYYGCFDFKVTDYHRDTFERIAKEMPIYKFFFIRSYFKNPKITCISLDRNKKEKFVDKSNIKNLWDMGNSGSNASHVSIALGYKKIILVGVDCSYIDFLPEAEKQPDGSLKIIKNPTTNPNYWFDQYQQIGDIYNVPNANIFHQPAWQRLSRLAPLHGIKVLNCSEGSTLKCFEKSTVSKILFEKKKLSLKYIKKKLQSQIKKISIIFNVKLNPSNTNMISNLVFTINWFIKNYGLELYDYILLEQDDTEKIKMFEETNVIKKIFLYNPNYFNRGWGFNVVTKKYVKSKVVVFCDADIILSDPQKLIDAIEKCKKEKMMVSPYNYVTFTNNQERDMIMKNNEIDKVKLESQYPVTIAGGITVVNRSAFLNLGGFEEYTVYGGEDRSLDVLFLENYKAEMLNCYGIHLYHPKNTNYVDTNKMLTHLKNTYNCSYQRSLNEYDYIHKLCKHKNKQDLKTHIRKKILYFGDPNLYKTTRHKYINGIPI